VQPAGLLEELEGPPVESLGGPQLSGPGERQLDLLGQVEYLEGAPVVAQV